MDYTDHNAVSKALGDAQGADKDQRQEARDAHLFIDKKDGQWEPYWYEQAGKNNSPRYTFDITGPIVDQVAGDITESDFDIKVNPAGGDSTKEDAELLDGMIRNIENISGAKFIYNHSARSVVTSGIDGWEVVQAYVDGDSFDQDLMIEPINNFTGRVWFDPSSEKQDGSDAEYCFKLQGVSPDKYEERWPKGSKKSVSSDQKTEAYYYKNNDIVVGQFYFKKYETRELYLMTDGRILEEGEDFDAIQDELAAAGVTIERTRKRKKATVYSRMFDGGGWLNKEQETVFEYLPVIPAYGNFKVFENKILYRGIVEKAMDAQRVYNYSLSREIAEGALAPRSKYWVTRTQAGNADDRAKMQTMNTNHDPVQLYTADPAAPPPMQQGGAQVNPGLRTISETMRGQLGQTAGMFAANMGDNPGLQSGVAIKKLQDKGNLGTNKFFTAMEIAIQHTAKIIVQAIPKVYDTRRMVRILKDDGSFTNTMLNDEVLDNQTGKSVRVNDLSKGKYDVVCTSGPSFSSRQDETAAGILEVATVYPQIMETGSDILLSNMNAPGMGAIADRDRAIKFNAGLIPPEQFTEEEAAMAQAAAQQPPQEDPNMLIGKAELIKAENEQARTQVDVQEKTVKLQLEQQKIQLDAQKFQHQAQQDELSNQIKLEELRIKKTTSAHSARTDIDQKQANIANTEADTLKKLREASGADAIMNGEVVQAYDQQAQNLNDTLDQ